MCDCPAVHALQNGSVVVWCQPLVNFPPTSSVPKVEPIYINQGWGTPFQEKVATITIPGWLKHAAQVTRDNEGWIKLDDPTIWVDEQGYWHGE